MENEKTTFQTMKYIYTKSDDYKIIYANGIYGGITLQGELCFDLFQEYRPGVKEEIHKIEKDGRIGDRINLESEIDGQQPDQAVMIRERKIGITMSIDQARSFVQWMTSKINNYELLIKQTGGKSQDESQ